MLGVLKNLHFLVKFCPIIYLFLIIVPRVWRCIIVKSTTVTPVSVPAQSACGLVWCWYYPKRPVSSYLLVIFKLILYPTHHCSIKFLITLQASLLCECLTCVIPFNKLLPMIPFFCYYISFYIVFIISRSLHVLMWIEMNELQMIREKTIVKCREATRERQQTARSRKRLSTIEENTSEVEPSDDEDLMDGE